MNPEQRRQLLNARSLTVDEFRKLHPELAQQLLGSDAPPNPQQPLSANPAIMKEIAAARLQDVSELAALSASEATALSSATSTIAGIDETRLATLVAEKKLTDQSAHRFGLAAAVYRLADENVDLARAIASTPANSTLDLAKLNADEWAQRLRAANVPLPADTTIESVAASLAKRFAVIHPGIAAAAHLPSPGWVADDALVRAYPGLGLDAVIRDSATVARRVGFVQHIATSVGLDMIMRLDLSDGSKDIDRLGFAQLGVSAEEQKLIVATFKSFQRAFQVTKDHDDAQALVRSGFSSAFSVATLPFESFAKQSTFDAATTRRVWKAARRRLADGGLTVSALIDGVHGFFDKLGVSNQPASATQFLKSLPNYQELFGSLSFCDCKECASILGPAAYFVDLMKFIEINIRTPFFATRPNHPLDLKTRRPDLWSLVLSCDNTNSRVPTLDLINEAFENFIAQRLGYSGSLDDRTAIAKLVYEQTLTKASDSFSQPFDLSLARIDSYLTALGSSRGEVARALAAPAADQTRAGLQLSSTELSILTTPDANLTHLSHLYGIAFQGTAAAVSPVDAAVLTTAMGLSRADLGALCATWFVGAGGATVAIVAGKADPTSVQNDTEVVSGLTADALDRMHRFTRLRRKSQWSVADLDQALKALATTTLTNLDPLAQLHALTLRLSATVVDLCVAIAPTPDIPQPLFDSLFNAPSFVATSGSFPQPTTRFIVPAFRKTTPATLDPALPRLLGGLSIDLDTLTKLARQLAPHLAQETAPGFDPNAPNEADRYFVLSAQNLALLYRHARLARLLGLSTDDLFQLLGFLGRDRVAGLADLQALVDLIDWWRGSHYTLDDIGMATLGLARDTSQYPDPAATAAQIVAASAGHTSFSNTIFSVALGTSEQGSRDLVASNPALVESTADGKLQLVAGGDLETLAITIPPTATVATPTGPRALTAVEVRNALRPSKPSVMLARSLAGILNFSADKIVALAALAKLSLGTTAVEKAVRGDGPTLPLEQLVARIRPLAVALASPAWTATDIEFVRQHPQLFGTQSLPQTKPAPAPPIPFVALDQLQALSTYQRLAERAGTLSDLQSVLTQFTAAAFSASTDAAMARLLNVSSSLVVGLRGVVTLPAVAAPALDRFDRAAQLAVALGVDGAVFGNIISTDYQKCTEAADALASALSNRFADEAARKQKAEQAEQPIREQKRDALADYLIRSIQPQAWSSLDQLYEYFLIDVQAGGCATTSRVVQATLSAQLYVYRVIMRLEQDGFPATSPNHVDVMLGPDAKNEWQWRQNFRVWQANRKVFLWPENYLEPDLRDDKTPLFKDLEQDLLQTDISDENVLDAYTKYLAGFEEVASLTIAGAYHEFGQDSNRTTDVLHLFGTTAADPPTYYYRSCEDFWMSGHDPVDIAPVWSPWQKVGVQIGGRQVAPVMFNGRLHVFWIDFKTRPFNQVSSGTSQFAGYRHNMGMKFTTLRPSGSWTAPQEVQLPIYDQVIFSGNPAFGPSRGQVQDPLTNKTEGIAKYDRTGRYEYEPIDDYTLSGPNWDGLWLYPAYSSSDGAYQLEAVFRNFGLRKRIDLFARTLKDPPSLTGFWPPTLLFARNAVGARPLYSDTDDTIGLPFTAWANVIIDESRVDIVTLDSPAFKPFYTHQLYQSTNQVASVPANTILLAVPNNPTSAILQVANDIIHLHYQWNYSFNYGLRRIGTTLADTVARTLFESGVDGLLATQTQLGLAEAPQPITLVGTAIQDHSNFGKLDFNGPYGVYYRELFFHIPFLIANALNSRGRFAAAQRWYHYIFDPTSTEQINVVGVPPGDVAHRLLDRVWRYREFRGLDVAKLRDILTDKTAIALYKKDPFNPWAIARRRISAFQKAIVMKYVDNLIDWGDSLFSQFTSESVNEALMLYIMASDILGPRPYELGDCGGGVDPMTYDKIGPLIDKSSEILIELESFNPVPDLPPLGVGLYMPPKGALEVAIDAVPMLSPSPPATGVFRGFGWNATRTASWAPAQSNSTIDTRDGLGGRSFANAWTDTSAEPYAWSAISLAPVFCVPVNDQLLGYWDRVQDRLFKIRHCMDIDGNKRELALFAPPINPMQLVAMKAAGLSLEEVLASTNGDLPPYRFTYLIEHAKAVAATLSGYGSALLSAMEKKDVEQLNRLRLTQQMNLLQMQSHSQQLEIDAAAQTLASLQQQSASAKYRSDFYNGLIQEERNGWEITQSVAQHLVSAIQAVEATLGLISAITHLIPQIGSPFAMKFGGLELGSSFSRFADSMGTLSAIAQAVAASAGLEATFARRLEEWRNQKALADYDVGMFDRQIQGASIGLDIANRALDIHELQIEQTQETLDLTDGKFTNLGLYTWLSQQHQRVFRAAYRNALALGKLAEQAYRFERSDDTTAALLPSYWDATHAGLWCGEQLLVDLQTLERRFLETNYRTLEIEQSFSLAQLNPAALVSLRQNGECEFTIDEAYFDLFYPGHYKRRIKGVRLTIPCITGPFVNAAATLNLQRSWIRPTPTATAALVEVPPSRSVSIATSSARNDSGVFEFSFRDERYMPFEGLGAVSKWSLTLPKTWRAFDYQTIADVVIAISYQAEQDGALREAVEQQNGTLFTYFSQTTSQRLMSLRQDFSAAYAMLVNSTAATPVQIPVAASDFPFFFSGRKIQVQRAALVLNTPVGQTVGNVQITVDATTASSFQSDPTLGGLAVADLGNVFSAGVFGAHTISIANGGDLAPSTGGNSAVDESKLLDLFIYLEYKIM